MYRKISERFDIDTMLLHLLENILFSENQPTRIMTLEKYSSINQKLSTNYGMKDIFIGSQHNGISGNLPIFSTRIFLRYTFSVKINSNSTLDNTFFTLLCALWVINNMN